MARRGSTRRLPVWGGVPVQQCTVRKQRTLLPHAPELPYEEITSDYNDMIYATTPEEIVACRKAFIHMAVEASRHCRQLRGSGRSFVHVLAPATETRAQRPHDQCDRAIARGVPAADQNPTVLPSAYTAAMMLWALLASGQISMRKVDGWQTHRSAD
jgi:putative transposase